MVTAAERVRGCYSVYYSSGFDGTLALDWSYWGWHGAWSISYKGYHGSRWQFVGSILDAEILEEHLTLVHPEVSPIEEAYDGLLEHFGLYRWREEFPLEMVARMSPAQLIAERRKKEAEQSLERYEAVSNTLGSRLSAEEYK